MAVNTARKEMRAFNSIVRPPGVQLGIPIMEE
jgi:hypothetical protein